MRPALLTLALLLGGCAGNPTFDTLYTMTYAMVKGACDQPQFRPGAVSYRQVSQYSRSMQTLRATCMALSPLMPKFEADDERSQ